MVDLKFEVIYSSGKILQSIYSTGGYFPKIIDLYHCRLQPVDKIFSSCDDFLVNTIDLEF